MSASRVGKWRYSVPGPTPARRAMSSSVALAPCSVYACLAASRMSSRLRCASARGLRSVGGGAGLLVIRTRCGKEDATGASLRLAMYSEIVSVLVCERDGSQWPARSLQVVPITEQEDVCGSL